MTETPNSNAVPAPTHLDTHFAMPIMAGGVDRDRLEGLVSALTGAGWKQPVLDPGPGDSDGDEWIAFFIPSVSAYFGGRSSSHRRQARVFERLFDKDYNALTNGNVRGVPLAMLVKKERIPILLERARIVVFSTGCVFLSLKIRLDDVDKFTTASMETEQAKNHRGSLKPTPGRLATVCAALSKVGTTIPGRITENVKVDAGHWCVDSALRFKAATTNSEGHFSLPTLSDWCLNLGETFAGPKIEWLSTRTNPTLSYARIDGAEPGADLAEDFWRLRHGFGADHLGAPRDVALDGPEVLELGRAFHVGVTPAGVAILHLPARVGRDGSDVRRAARVERSYLLHMLLALHQRVQVTQLLGRAADLPAPEEMRADPNQWKPTILALRDDMLEFTLRHRFAVVSEGTYYARMYARLTEVLVIDRLFDELRDETDELAQLVSDLADREEEQARERRANRLNNLVGALAGPSLGLALLGSNLAPFGQGALLAKHWVFFAAVCAGPWAVIAWIGRNRGNLGASERDKSLTASKSVRQLPAGTPRQ